MQLSIFGEKLSQESGILNLMKDLGEAVAFRPDMLTLGGGNPAAIPEIQEMWRRQMRLLLDNPSSFDKSLVCYDDPQGDPRFCQAFANLMREKFGLPINSKNVAVVSGAQLGAFSLLNLIAGRTSSGRKRKILTPLSPEYVGYADLGVEPDLFAACPAKITYPDPEDPSVFKYAVDFDAVERAFQENDIAAILVSRPTNPSGNLIEREELAKLDELAERFDSLLIIDSAYGGPFPGIVEDESELDSVFWTPRVALFYSLSKIGLPGVRTAMLVASEEIVERISAVTAIVGLANNALGQRIATPFFESGEILRISREIARPYYRARRKDAIDFLKCELKRVGVDGRLHKSEGAFFLWLWTPDLKQGSKALYHRLKEKGVLAIPGDEFFYGLDDSKRDERDPVFESSRSQCLRISFSSPTEVVRRGIAIIAETLSEMINGL